MAETIGTIISSATKAMIDLLNAEAGFAEGDIVMQSPAEAQASAKVSLFLYQIEENEFMKNRDQEEVGLDGLRKPPLPLDLYYLITPLVSEPVTALGHLETIMRVFYDHAVLEPPLLPPTLVDAGNETIRLTNHMLSLEDKNRLWGMFPNKTYNLSVSYLLSPVRVPSSTITAVTRVIEKTTKVYQTGV